jgi:hypothetical protein
MRGSAVQETPQPGYEEAFVDVAGARVYYLHAGSGKPMLLIHGSRANEKVSSLDDQGKKEWPQCVEFSFE